MWINFSYLNIVEKYIFSTIGDLWFLRQRNIIIYQRWEDKVLLKQSVSYAYDLSRVAKFFVVVSDNKKWKQKVVTSPWLRIETETQEVCLTN